ncbi:MAG: YihY family inner membrane protein [Pseudomonadota bacterium]
MENAKAMLAELWRRIAYLVSRFSNDECLSTSAALTYMSLFALVPLITVSYTMASAVPAFQGLEEQINVFLYDNLLPDTSSEIQNYLSEFSRQAKNLTGVGIGFLVITAILMLRSIEKAFNGIWRTRQNRSAVSSFLLYWAVLSLAPMTIGLALGINTYLASFSVIFQDIEMVAGTGLKLAPLALYTMGFTLLYVAVPNCRVPLRHAIFGGLFAAVAFSVARTLFTKLVANSSYTFIYGAFAAVPLFLLWIYLSWNIVLLGGILVHSLSAYQDKEQAGRPNVLKALDVLYLFWKRQHAGGTVREIEMLNARHEAIRGLDSETWAALRDVFVKRKLITEDSRGHYLLCRDLHTVTFWQLKEWINDELPLNQEEITTQLSWQGRAYQLLRNQRHEQRDTLNTTLDELYSQ